jgi:hypothetical protein
MAYEPVALFQLCWRASGDAGEILRQAIPDTPALRGAYLDFLVSTNRLGWAPRVEISQRAGAQLDLLLRYCDAW